MLDKQLRQQLFLSSTPKVRILDKSGNIKINHSSKNGYGVKSINKIVKKYDGSIKYSQSEDTLACSIAIYNG